MFARYAPYEAPSWRRDWRTLLLIALVTLCAGMAMRLQELPAWMAPEYIVDGEFIMGTHDAYHWLAGAEGVGSAADQPPATLARWVAGITGTSVANVAFFLPVVFGGLAAVAVVLWAWALGGLPAGLLAGVLATLAPGYYMRSRLGYYDTDIVTLLFPLLVSWGLAFWMSPLLRSQWFDVAQGGDDAETATSVERPDAAPAVFGYATQQAALRLAAPVVVGLFGAWAAEWHGHMRTFVQGSAFLMLILALAAGRPGQRGELLWGVVLFSLAAFWGWIGALVGAGLAAGLVGSLRMQATHRRLLWRWTAPLLAAALTLGVSQLGEHSLVGGASSLVGDYLKPAAQQTSLSESGLDYPGIGQSIIEAQDLSTREAFQRLHPWTWLGMVGAGGFVILLLARPQALFLAPFLLLALSSVQLGTRMAMFGAPAMGLGLAMVLYWALRPVFGEKPWASVVMTLVMAVVTIGLAMPAAHFSTRLSPTPVLNRHHVEALLQLGERHQGSFDDGVVWTWWDWGYATHYYAHVKSFADGGRHYGEHVFTLGLALTTPNPLQSAQLMQFSSLHEDEPWTQWNRWGLEKTSSFIRELGETPLGYSPEKPIYVVVTFENIRLSPWITYYGTWSFTKREGVHARIANIRDSFNLDWREGIMHFTGEDRSLDVRAVHAMGEASRRDVGYPRNTGPNLLLNAASRQYYALDELAYQGMLTQLLLAKEDSPLLRHFTMVYDDFPWVRVYEVVSPQPALDFPGQTRQSPEDAQPAAPTPAPDAKLNDGDTANQP